MSKTIRVILGVVIVLVTIAIFVDYLTNHRYLLTQLTHTSPLTIVLLLLLYCLWFGSLIVILQASLRICRKVLKKSENSLLNAYSTLVNFFIPGQGGPIVRGMYLKKFHGLLIRNYIVVTLLYYAAYAAVSALLLLVGSRPWWWTVIAVLIVSGISYLVVMFYSRRNKIPTNKLDLSAMNLLYLLAATLLQAVVQVTIYSVELHTVNRHITLWQSMTYTGAANFALFVALTPGAIGIRESFLVFSEKLHHISSANIVAANIIDRGVFIVFLAILFVLTLVFRGRSGFHPTSRISSEAKSKQTDDEVRRNNLADLNIT
jgi:uncharacterized membrane protein YbhN (UPF0104 family)